MSELRALRGEPLFGCDPAVSFVQPLDESLFDNPIDG
jgi:hypothetical protein